MPIALNTFVLFVVYVLTSCGGLYFMKAAADWKTPTFILGVVLYGAGALMWLAIVRMMPLSQAFPIAAGSLMIGTMLSGYFLLSEIVTAWHVVGALLIFSGITVIAFQR